MAKILIIAAITYQVLKFLGSDDDEATGKRALDMGNKVGPEPWSEPHILRENPRGVTMQVSRKCHLHHGFSRHEQWFASNGIGLMVAGIRGSSTGRQEQKIDYLNRDGIPLSLHCSQLIIFPWPPTRSYPRVAYGKHSYYWTEQDL